MPSPFPGMNPYLEKLDAWHDFHERFMPTAAAMIGPQVGPNYIVKIDEQIYVHDLFADERRLLGRGDVFVANVSSAASESAGTAVLGAPAMVALPSVDMEGQSVIEIRDRLTREVVTVVELLSPSNKMPGPDRQQYLAKRGRLLSSATNFVEIDLLRGGPRMPMADVPECDYCVLVSRAEDRPQAGIWPVRLRDRLPVIPIPLRAGDPIPQLDLQHVLHRVYDEADYQKYVYDDPVKPPLNANDAAWAAQLVAQ
jgi:hypothetical protein